jgi:hypothetical protein
MLRINDEYPTDGTKPKYDLPVTVEFVIDISTDVYGSHAGRILINTGLQLLPFSGRSTIVHNT